MGPVGLTGVWVVGGRGLREEAVSSDHQPGLQVPAVLCSLFAGLFALTLVTCPILLRSFYVLKKRENSSFSRTNS